MDRVKATAGVGDDWTGPATFGPVSISWQLGKESRCCRVWVKCAEIDPIMDTVLSEAHRSEEFSVRWPGQSTEPIAGELRYAPESATLILLRLCYPGGHVHDRILTGRPPLPPVPLPEVDELPVDVEPVADVFTYVHLQDWPRATESEIARNFVRYAPVQCVAETAAVTSYYQRLVELRSASADPRAAMVAETLRFVQGEGMYEGQYAARVDQLSGPLRHLGRLGDELARHPPPTLQALVVAVEHAFDGEPWSCIASKLHDAAFVEQLERVWLSLFALNAVVAFDREAVEQLTPTMVLAELLRKLPAEGPMPDWSGERIASELRATPLLPATVFPLPAAVPPRPEEPAVPPVWPYAIGRLRTVRRKLLGHRRGALAHIENVMAGERKVRARRERLRSQDELGHRLLERQDVRQADHLRHASFEATTERMLREAFRADYSTTYGPAAPGTQTGYIQLNWPQDGQPPDALPATRQTGGSQVSLGQALVLESARRFAGEMDDRRQLTLKSDVEFAASQCFDRRDAAEHQRGIYHWLDSVHECWEVEHGRRWLLEITLPKPGRALHGRWPMDRRWDVGADPLALRRLIHGELRRQALRSFVALSRRKTGADAVPDRWLPSLHAWLERVIEWKELSWLLIDELDDEVPAWPVADEAEQRLHAFLFAAFAQLLLPVRPGYEMAVAYFLATGSIWEAPPRLAPTFESAVAESSVPAPLRFVDLVLALREAGLADLAGEGGAVAPDERPIGPSWTVVLPTSMTLLQKADGLSLMARGHGAAPASQEGE